MAPTNAGPKREREQRRATRLDSDVTRPQVTQPGDAPYDTTDPDERASSASFDVGAAAAGGHGTVNAVVPVPTAQRVEEPEREHRKETYPVVGPDGKLVTVHHNIDTGETSTS